MGGCQHSNVDGNRLVAPNALDFTFLQDSQQRNLNIRRQVTDFVYKNSPAICGFETAEAPLSCAGEGALLVTEKLGRNQRRWDCRAIHRDERPLGPCGSFVDAPRNKFLSGPGLAKDKNCRIGRRYLSDLPQYFAQRFRRTDDVLKHRLTVDLLSQCQIFVACLVLGFDPVIDIGSRGIPASKLTLLISKRVVAD